MHRGALALGIIIDVGIVKARHIITLGQLGGLPVGIAMRHTVAQVMHIIVQVIKVDQQVVITVHHEHRGEVHIAGKAHLEGAHVAVKDMRPGVHLVLRYCRNCDQRTRHEA